MCVCIDIWMIYSDTTNTNLTYITKSTRYITFDKYVILRWLTYRCTFTMINLVYLIQYIFII